MCCHVYGGCYFVIKPLALALTCASLGGLKKKKLEVYA